MEEKLLGQQKLFKNMILIQLKDNREAEYKELKSKGLLSDFIDKQSQQMIDELRTILSDTNSLDIQRFYEAVEIVIYNHIIEEDASKLYGDDILEEDIDTKIESKILTSDDIVELLYPELTRSILLKNKWEILSYKEYGVVFVNDNLQLIDIDGYMTILKKIDGETLSKETTELNLDDLKIIVLYVNSNNYDIVLQEISENEKQRHKYDNYRLYGLKRKLTWFAVWSFLFVFSLYSEIREVSVFLFLIMVFMGYESYLEWKKNKLRYKKLKVCSDINKLIKAIQWNKFTNADIDNLILKKEEVKFLFYWSYGIDNTLNKIINLANTFKAVNLEVEKNDNGKKKKNINNEINELSKELEENCKRELKV